MQPSDVHYRPAGQPQWSPLVVLADDDPACLAGLSGEFRRQGAEIALCSAGADAWNILRQHDGPLMAILNWMLPDVDGLVLADDLVRHRPDALAVLLIGRPFILSARESLGLKGHYLLAKPLPEAGLDKLAARLMRLGLQRHREATQGRQPPPPCGSDENDNREHGGLADV
jgi:DNA-binding NtrC family response regulator